ncbi:MAG: Concanavalin A-like lectin/glucanase superfamily [Fibrobacteres bacterium]|nr:Concanavalin A-like lectin/glucanase superfamily [Fibrobacterota bacterium]
MRTLGAICIAALAALPILAAGARAHAAAAPGAGHYLLSLDFGDTAAPGRQTVELPALVPVGPISISEGTADFGRDAVLKWQDFTHPQGPFTVEARFFVREYAYIEDLINTATWDDGPVQGFIFRVGGGFFYPILPRSAYGDESLFEKSVSDFDNTGRADLSRCVGEFAFATRSGGTAQWLEVYTDRCAERGQWNHMVAVWDGKDARIYLNGHDATDVWRLNGVGSRPMLDPVVRLTVGGRRPLAGGDDRHLDGKMDFARILDTAMGAQQIRQRYQDGLPDAAGRDFCHGVLIPVSPAAGQLCGKDSKFRFKVEVHGACADTTVKWDFKPGDSAEVEFARDAGFKDILLRFTVEDLEFNIDKALAEKGGVFSGAVYWRVRWTPKAPDVLAKTAAETGSPEWSDPKPLFLAYALPVGTGSPGPGSSARASAFRPRLSAVQGGYLLEDLTGPDVPRIYGLDGRAAPVRATRLSRGRWKLAVEGGGVYLLRTAQGALPLIF